MSMFDHVDVVAVLVDLVVGDKMLESLAEDDRNEREGRREEFQGDINHVIQLEAL
jgi:hypothetical protein